jgi:predicted nicotinamide N-methyase
MLSAADPVLPPAGAIPCSDASALPPLPSGVRLELLALGEQAAGVGGRLWNAAPKLCRWMLAQQELIQDSIVIELGSGTGACGLMAAGLGAVRVVLSDGGPPALLKLCAYNVQQNRAACGASCGLEVKPYRWGEQSVADALGSSVVDIADWILASDVRLLFRSPSCSACLRC